MMEPVTSKETTKRWEFLRGIQKVKPRKMVAIFPSSVDSSKKSSGQRKRSFQKNFRDQSSNEATSSQKADPVGDPFDCGSIAFLPLHEIVENEIHRYLEEWNKLDNRKIPRRSTASELPRAASNHMRTQGDEKLSIAVARDADDTDTDVSKKTFHGGGWRAMEDRLSLPDGFDYTTNSSGQQIACKEGQVDEECDGDLVISLEDPTQRLSYHRELSKLFRSIPCYRELETQTRLGHRLQHTFRLYQETLNPIKSAPDCYTQARLRMPDRHGLPQPLRSFSNYNIQGRRQNQYSDSRRTTVILEIWRKAPKQLTSSGCNRMVMEFLSSQTLWDVHLVLTQMVEDDLWIASQDDIDSTHDNKMQTKSILSTECSEGDKNLDQKKASKQSQKRLSGCFFIEGTFYIAGSVNYAKPIIDWIDSAASNRSTPIRRGYLGINSSHSISNVKKMKRTKLSQVPFRPNIRYYHSCHGDVETTILLVDRISVHQERYQNENENDNPLYPLIHDIWTAPLLPTVPLCDACQIYQSIFKTSTDCKLTDGGPRSLCQECCRDLNVLEKEPGSVKLYRQWHDQINLSKSVSHEQSTIVAA